MKVFVSYLKPYKWLIIVSLLLGAVYQVFAMLDPHFIGVIVDKFASHPHYNGYYNSSKEFVKEGTRTREEFFTGIFLYISIIITVTIVSRIAKVFQDYTINIIVQKAGADIFADGIKHALQLSYEEFENQRSGETVAVLQKVKLDFERLFVSSLNILYSTIVAICFIVIYALNIHWSILPVFFAGIFAISFLSKILTKRIKNIQRKIVNEVSSLAGSTTESLRNIEIIKSSGLTQQEVNRLHGNTNDILNLEIKKVKQIRILNFIQGASINFFRQILMFILLVLIYNDQLTTGNLLALSFYSFFIFDPLYDIGKISIFYSEAQTSMDKLQEMLQKGAEQKPAKTLDITTIESLEFSRVHFRYNTSTYNALNNISFNVKTGETIAFVGPSGSGKSTLARILMGLYKPSAGDIFYNQINSRNIDFETVRNYIGFVSQDTQLFTGTIKENLLIFSPFASDSRIQEVLHMAACQSLLNRSNKGINTVLGEGGIKISGGEKQRISIARALIRNPHLLLFDEATSSLDYLTEEEIASTIRTLSTNNKLITILIAHRLSTIMHADRIYVLERGSIIETGCHQLLLAQKGLYYAMWRQQIGERRN